MTTTILLSLALASPPAEASTETVQAIDLVKMTYEEAVRHEGKVVRASLTVAVCTEFDLCEFFADAGNGRIRAISGTEGSFNRVSKIKGSRLTVIGVLRTGPGHRSIAKFIGPPHDFVHVEDAIQVSP